MTPRKIIVSAFAFSPSRGSEFGVGWDYVRAISANYEVWVLTRSNEREEVEAHLDRHPELRSCIHVHYVPWSSSRFGYVLREIPYYFMFVNWQRRAFRLARELDATFHFDAAHQLTPVGFREPGFLWKMDCPFFWGPVVGMQYFPAHLVSAVPLRNRPFFLAKNVATWIAFYLWRRPKLAGRKAGILIAGSNENARMMNVLWKRSPTAILCEVNAPERSREVALERHEGEPLRIVWSGNCNPGKALNLVLRALALLRNKSPEIAWELMCLGDGPLLSSWQALAQQLGIADRCHFAGRLPRPEALRRMASQHCFVQPSLYEATSSVLVEALSNGLPAICLDHFGFRDVVDASCGIRIPTQSVDQIIRCFAAAIELLARNEPLRREMAQNALLRSEKLTRRHNELVLEELYSSYFEQTTTS